MTGWNSRGWRRETIDVSDDDEESEVLEEENVVKKEVIENVSDLTGGEHVPDNEESHVLYNGLKIAAGSNMFQNAAIFLASKFRAYSPVFYILDKLASFGAENSDSAKQQLSAEFQILKIRSVVTKL